MARRLDPSQHRTMRRWVLVAAMIAVVLVAAVSAHAARSRTPASSSPANLTVDDPSASSTVLGRAGSALAVLATIPVKGRAAMTGYSREKFGAAWADVDHNGCDTRDDILRRDLTRTTFRAGSRNCVVMTGTLAEPYTGKVVAFVRGPHSSAVQIDHVVALGDAWQTGAATWPAARREQLANDRLELLAVDGPANEAKGDGDAATWLPPNKAYRCAYVARQVAVKSAYGLWMTAAEKAAATSVLDTCPDQQLPRGTAAGDAAEESVQAPQGSASAPPAAADSPTTAVPTTAVPTGAATVHAGSYCAPAGAVGVTEAGTSMVCSATAAGTRPRWRSATG